MAEVIVPLEELAPHLGGSIELVRARLARAGVEATVDWAGRPGVPAEVAAELVQGWQQDQLRHAEKVRAYEAYLAQRERDREEAGRAAYTAEARRQLDAEARALAADHFTTTTNVRLTLSPRGREAARRAREEALREWDQRHGQPVPFAEFKG